MKDKRSRPDNETLRLLRDIVDEIGSNPAITAGGTIFSLTIEIAPVPGFTVEEPALPVLRHLLDRLRHLDMPSSDVRLERVFEILDRVGVKPDWQESLGIAKAAYSTAQQVSNTKVQDPDEPPVTDPTRSPTWIRPREAFGLWAYGGVMPRVRGAPQPGHGRRKGAVQDRTDYYDAHRLQRTIFEIAAKIADDLKFGDEAGRRIMFPQVLRIVRQYVQTRVDPAGGASLEEIALGQYRRTIESRLTAAIRPADDEDEQPLLPVLDDMAGIGTTDVTPFLTVKPCQPTLRSHLSQAVCDSGWERTVARALDESPRVLAWAKNHRLGFEVPYLHSGVAHSFIPDFLVDVVALGREDGVEHLVVEVKGLEREQDRSKDVGAARWIAAVNHWDRLGQWRYAKIHSPHELTAVLG